MTLYISTTGLVNNLNVLHASGSDLLTDLTNSFSNDDGATEKELDRIITGQHVLKNLEKHIKKLTKEQPRDWNENILEMYARRYRI